jgi:hypothetical protein
MIAADDAVVAYFLGLPIHAEESGLTADGASGDACEISTDA